jgi:hypothetical protein
MSVFNRFKLDDKRAMITGSTVPLARRLPSYAAVGCAFFSSFRS